MLQPPSRSRAARPIARRVAPELRAAALCLLAFFAIAARAAPFLDVNGADAATLAAELPGIGPVKAARIVAHRERHGPFREPEALLAVAGIGPATLARIAPLLRFDGAPATTGAPAAPSARATAALSAEERAVREAVRRLIDLALEDAATRGAGAPTGPPPAAR